MNLKGAPPVWLAMVPVALPNEVDLIFMRMRDGSTQGPIPREQPATSQEVRVMLGILESGLSSGGSLGRGDRVYWRKRAGQVAVCWQVDQEQLRSRPLMARFPARDLMTYKNVDAMADFVAHSADHRPLVVDRVRIEADLRRVANSLRSRKGRASGEYHD